MGFELLIEDIILLLATLDLTVNTTPNSPLYIAPNTSFNIAIDIP